MNDYFDLIIIGLSSSFLYGVFGLLLGGFVVFYLHRKGYLNRESWLLKVITRSYFILFPIAFGLLCWFLASIRITVGYYEQVVQEVVSDIEEYTYPIFIEFIGERLDTYLEAGSVPTNEEIVSLFIATHTDPENTSLYNHVLSIGLITILEISIGKDEEKERRLRTLNEGFYGSVFEIGFETLRLEVTRKGSQYIKILQIPIIVAFLTSLLFPIIEIYISKKVLADAEKKSELTQLGKAVKHLTDEM